LSTSTYFDVATWDGSDVFSPEGSTAVFVRERMKAALQIKVTNVASKDLPKVEQVV
jgi:hypothetical protein